ncbi:MFS transporter [Staphylococcus sp. ACRSN]|uniref:multidrug efflux MFS transporter SdrM n=1 Tax=Staphylococcus sp. ACRSN TaxID=2918214 RepID=UPI001EF16431|nr:multidrug efflux MFS transporter SdrM [Staphylococcus sp. ACRSN]MCG7338346.1 MFS transporter [Staphylococcus sp. ACRSN]
MNIKSIGIVIALLLIMFMSAIETSIVSLALPTIKDDLNVTSSISLIFAVYFIAIVIANPIVGELLERTKMIYITIFGLLCFLIGSLFSGLSETFTILIVSRFIQGLGAGIMMALCQIVPKLAFEIPLRYKIMGIVGSVWGISSIIGPVLGGGILEFATWHWLFFVNIPIAILAMILVLITFHFDDEQTEKDTNNKLDVKGLTLFYIFILFLLLTVMNTTNLFINIVSFIVACLIAIVLYKNEKRINNPFVPVKEFNKMIVLVFATDFLFAIMLMGYNLYMPVYLQEELGLSPLQSGFVIFPISLAWLLLNFSLGKIEAHFARKTLYLAAFTSLMISSILIFIGTDYPIFIAFSLLFAGVSFGTVYTKNSVITQEETSPEHMKRMMSLYTLTKSLGNSLGSTIMGYVYSMSIVFLGLNIHNVLLVACMILIGLIILWSFIYKPKTENNPRY